jgi:hypothetical protein
MGVIGTITVALFSGFTSGMFTMQMARENLRATQIMLEKMETLRLYSWDQLKTMPAHQTWDEKYDPNAAAGAQGMNYRVNLYVEPVPLTTSYASDMKMVRVTLDWSTGTIKRSRSFSTYVAHNGLQTYIY